MTDDLIPWLRSIWDDEERKALAVPEGRRSWHVDGAGVLAGHPTDPLVDWVYDEGAAEHIALHDPAHVLAEVDAKRRILALHDEQHDCDGDPRSYADPYEGCRTLRLLALPYADRPGYREEWKP